MEVIRLRNLALKNSAYSGQTNPHGQRHGYGSCSYPDGSTYIGEWSEDQRHGQGLYKRPDGTTYKGMFFDDEMHGKG